MDKVTLYVEKSEPYCLILDFIDMEEFLAFKNLCSVNPVESNADCSMLFIKNTEIRLAENCTFEVPVGELAKLNWQPSEMSLILYELDGRDETFATILPEGKAQQTFYIGQVITIEKAANSDEWQRIGMFPGDELGNTMTVVYFSKNRDMLAVFEMDSSWTEIEELTETDANWWESQCDEDDDDDWDFDEENN